MAKHWIPPKLVSRAGSPPAGDDWLHEIKYDGYRLGTRRDGQVCLAALVTALTGLLLGLMQYPVRIPGSVFQMLRSCGAAAIVLFRRSGIRRRPAPPAFSSARGRSVADPQGALERLERQHAFRFHRHQFAVQVAGWERLHGRR
jgi:hypothetical protein